MIHAWLDKPKPELQLVERTSGQVIACWKGSHLYELFESGLVSYEELSSVHLSDYKLVVKALILQMTCEKLCAVAYTMANSELELVSSID